VARKDDGPRMHEFNDPAFQRYLDRLRTMPEAEKRLARIEIYSVLRDESFETSIKPDEWLATRELRKKNGVVERRVQ
jgi:hypothetical protein